MTATRIVSILGGLPVYAEIDWSRGDGYTVDDDAWVDALYWVKRDGSQGNPVPESMYEKLEKHDPYWECEVTENVFEQLSFERYEAERQKIKDEKERVEAEAHLHVHHTPRPRKLCVL